MLYMCDIITEYNKEDIDMEQILIDAISLTDAFHKLVDHRKYVNEHIIELKDNRLLAHVEIKNSIQPTRHILIGEPKETI